MQPFDKLRANGERESAYGRSPTQPFVIPANAGTHLSSIRLGCPWRDGSRIKSGMTDEGMTKPSYLAVLERPAKAKLLSYNPTSMLYFPTWNSMQHPPCGASPQRSGQRADATQPGRKCDLCATCMRRMWDVSATQVGRTWDAGAT